MKKVGRRLKRRILRRAYDLCAPFEEAAEGGLGGLCLYYAAASVKVAEEQGVRLVLQAGSAFWKFIPDTEDDGMMDTSFGYQWSGGNVVGDVLPEIHCWAADPATREVVDLTLPRLPGQCLALLGREWRAPVPTGLWGRPTGVYRPDRGAMVFVRSLLDSLKVGMV